MATLPGMARSHHLQFPVLSKNVQHHGLAFGIRDLQMPSVRWPFRKVHDFLTVGRALASTHDGCGNRLQFSRNSILRGDGREISRERREFLAGPVARKAGFQFAMGRKVRIISFTDFLQLEQRWTT